MSDDAVLRVRNLVVGRGAERPLDGVSFDVRRGDRLGVVAEDGGSRSALVSALVGDAGARADGQVSFVPPDGDPVAVLDLSGSAARRFRWRHVALVPADSGASFNPVSTVGTAFEETLRAHGAGGRDGEQRAREFLAALGLEPESILDATPDELDRGRIRRAGLALALVLDPSVLLVEDPATLRLLADVSDALPEELAVVAVVSDPRSVAAFAERVAILYGGEIVESGPTSELVDDPEHPYTRELLGAF